MAKRVKRGQGNVRETRWGTWEAYVNLGRVPYTATYPTEKEAWAQLSRWKSDHVLGRLGVEKVAPAPAAISFENLARLLKIHKVETKRERPWSAGMTRWFDGHSKTVFRAAFSKRSLDQITPDSVRDWLDSQIDRPIMRPSTGKPSGRLVTRATVQHYERFIAMVFAFGVRAGRLKASPMASLGRITVADDERREERALTATEMRSIFEVVSGRDRAFFAVLAFAGLRESEARRMRWSWVDLVRGRLFVRKGKRGAGELPIGPHLRAALLELGDRPPADHVFPGFSRAGGGRGARRGIRESDGTPRDGQRALSQGGMRRPLQDALELAKIARRRVGFHSFRRGFATVLEDREKFSVVRALLRHSRRGKDMTGRYLYPSWEQLVAAIARLELAIMKPLQVVRRIGSEPADSAAG